MRRNVVAQEGRVGAGRASIGGVIGSIVDGKTSTEKVGVMRTGVRWMIRHDERARAPFCNTAARKGD